MGKVGVAVDTLLEKYRVEKPRLRSLLELLVSIVLSQKTTWKNVRKALENIRRKIGPPEALAEASIKQIEEAIRPAGLYRNKAPILKNIASTLTEQKLNEILEAPYPEAKKALTSVRGIGPKTADVFLMFARNEPVLPVDTHIARIMRRLGAAGQKDGYEEIRAKLEAEVPPEKRLETHLTLIRFGREVCTARNPKCEQCPIRHLCSYAAQSSRQSRPRRVNG